MKFQLVEEWRTVIKRSATTYVGIGAAVFGGLAQFHDELPALVDFIPKGTFAWLSILCAIAVPIARIFRQQEMRDAVAAGKPPPQDDPQ